MRKRRLLVAVLAASTVALGAGGATVVTFGATATASPSETAPQGTAGSRLGEAQVKQIALDFAASMGNPNPQGIEYVEGDHQQVVRAFSGDEVSDDAEVDAIVMHGHFVAKSAPVPPGASPPSGSVLILVVNAITGQMTDLGIQQETPNLSAFGPVHLSE